MVKEINKEKKMEKLHRTHEEIARDFNINTAEIMRAERKLAELKEKREQLLKEEEKKKHSLVELLMKGC